MDELKANKQDVVNCFSSAGSEAREVLKLLFGDKVFEFDYKSIKTVEDAYNALGIKQINQLATVSISENVENTLLTNALNSSKALFDLWIVCFAINNGKWVDEDDWRYYPYWALYSKEEIEEMGEAERKKQNICLLAGVHANSAENAGVRGAFADHRGSYSVTDGGFPLCLNSSEKAVYCGNQFRDLWFQYYGIILKEEGEK